jgi:hypothetical protein
VRVASTRLRGVLAGLLVVSAILFAVGTTIERHQDSDHAGETAATGTHSEAAESGSESSGGSTESGSRRTDERSQVHSETETRLFGVDTESVGLEVAAIALSFGLAIAVWLSRQRVVLVAVVVLGLVFAAGDARELAHQVSESRSGLAVIAAVLMGLHLVVAAVGAVLAIRRSPGKTAITQAAS